MALERAFRPSSSRSNTASPEETEREPAADLFLLNINQIQRSRNFALVSARYDRNTVEYIVTGNAIRRRRGNRVSAFVEILARKRTDLISRICSNLIVIVLIYPLRDFKLF